MDTDRNELLRSLPSINELLNSSATEGLLREYPHSVVTESLRDAVAKTRSELLACADVSSAREMVSGEAIVERARSIISSQDVMNLRRVINATGIILHTGLGRAVLSEKARDALAEAVRGYSSLETDLETGERGRRDSNVSGLLAEITGAEAAHVVNNNAAATLIILKTLAKGREVVVSRGQLVEIGGSYRIPDVMKESGATLVEVGTTNKTHLKDYRNAINENTALLMHVHQSNYRIVGFTKQVPTAELVELGREFGLPVMDDLGSGALVDYSKFGLAEEPTVQASVKAGADVICFSGDKLLGGPQAGIILGSKEIIEKIRKNPLARAVRVGKLTLASLEATLRLFRNPDVLMREHAVFKMISQSREGIEARAKKVQGELSKALPKGVSIELRDGISQIGGGSLAGEDMPTKLLAVGSANVSLDEVARKLRLGEPPIVCRIHQGALEFDLRTVQEPEEKELVQAVSSAFTG